MVGVTQQPQEEEDEDELQQARVELGGMQGHAQRSSGRGRRIVEDHGPGHTRRRSIVTSSFQAADSGDGTAQRQTGGKGIGGSPDGEAEMRRRRARRANSDRGLSSPTPRPYRGQRRTIRRMLLVSRAVTMASNATLQILSVSSESRRAVRTRSSSEATVPIATRNP